jgi:ASC-1-like (ASCH) protein
MSSEIKSFNVSEPWFSLIQAGTKSVEGRLAKSWFAEIQPGEIIRWTNEELKNEDEKPMQRKVITKVSAIAYYPDFEKYLAAERLKNCLPGVRTIKDGVTVYHKFYPKEERQKYKVMAIRLEVIPTKHNL